MQCLLQTIAAGVSVILNMQVYVYFAVHFVYDEYVIMKITTTTSTALHIVFENYFAIYGFTEDNKKTIITGN